MKGEGKEYETVEEAAAAGMEVNRAMMPEEIRARWDHIHLATMHLCAWFRQHTGGTVEVDNSTFPTEAPQLVAHHYRLPAQIEVKGHWETVDTDTIGYCVSSFLIFRISKNDPWFAKMDLKTLENEVRIDDGDHVIQVVLL